MKTAKKTCALCQENILHINYLDKKFLQNFIGWQGRIAYRKRTGVCAKHQRRLAQAIKRARHLALMPFSQK